MSPAKSQNWCPLTGRDCVVAENPVKSCITVLNSLKFCLQRKHVCIGWVNLEITNSNAIISELYVSRLLMRVHLKGIVPLICCKEKELFRLYLRH